uniref:Uncharacterized protein n=1 Tax=viral metagenome TaxID=1070528 RepID=A0A6H2A722_9ZZZZ
MNNIGDRSGLPDYLIEGPILRTYEVHGLDRRGWCTVYWWIAASSRSEAIARAKERFQGYDLTISIK